MGWKEQRANDRVEANDFSSEEIKVADLCKEMDFENLGPRDVRRAEAVHLYIDVTNFHRVIADAKDDTQKQKKFIRAASVLRKVQADILAEGDVARLQLQAARLHALAFKPYSDEAARAKASAIAAISLATYLADVFNKVFDDLVDFSFAAGMASGESYIANIGAKGERELISLGTCANLGAKIIGAAGTVRVTESVYNNLPDSLKTLLSKIDTDFSEKVYEASGLTWSKKPELAKALNQEFDTDKWRKRTEQYRDELPLSEIELSDAEVLIDMEALTERNSKRVDSAVLFADLDGFTQHVQNAENDDEVADLIRKLHMIRAEFHAVACQDFDGLVIQHRGDCMLVVAHLPAGEDFKAERAQEGLDIALGLQSSMEHVLEKHLGDKVGIHVALGLDAGKCIVSRLGKKGDREVVCLGAAVDQAERLQRSTCGKDIRLTANVYNELDESTAKNKLEKQTNGTYLLKGMTFPRITELELAEAAKSGRASVTGAKGGVVIGTVATQKAPEHLQMKPWRCE